MERPEGAAIHQPRAAPWESRLVTLKGTGDMQALIRFNRGLLKMPLHWQLWLMLLVTVNLVIPLCYRDRLEAQVVIGTLLAGVGLMTALTGLSGFTRLLGLGHIFGSRSCISSGDASIRFQRMTSSASGCGH